MKSGKYNKANCKVKNEIYSSIKKVASLNKE